MEDGFYLAVGKSFLYAPSEKMDQAFAKRKVIDPGGICPSILWYENSEAKCMSWSLADQLFFCAFLAWEKRHSWQVPLLKKGEYEETLISVYLCRMVGGNRLRWGLSR